MDGPNWHVSIDGSDDKTVVKKTLCNYTTWNRWNGELYLSQGYYLKNINGKNIVVGEDRETTIIDEIIMDSCF